MAQEVRRVKLTMIAPVLGTQPGNKNIHEDFISSKAPDAETREEELEHVPEGEMVAKEMTVFHRDPVTGVPEIPTYHIKGFFKSACGALRKAGGYRSEGLKAYKKAIDLNVFVFPSADDRRGRFIPIEGDYEIESCQRPLRASTPQGERVALANSEMIDGGTLEFDIVVLDGGLWNYVEEWLDYGVFNGLGQWRNAGNGAFVWEYC